MKKSILYIGEFDFENENVQAHLVKNNGKILEKLGYEVFYIGVNRKIDSNIYWKDVKIVIKQLNNTRYVGLPNTFTMRGIFDYKRIVKYIEIMIYDLIKNYNLKGIITYQAPTYALILKRIVKICINNNIKYIVNSADIPIFESQPFVKKIVMKCNWNYLHKINKNNADGIIAVSKYIEKFYFKENRPSIVIPPLFSDTKIVKKYVENKIPVFFYAGTPFVILNREVKINGMKDRLDKIIDLMLELNKYNYKIVFKIFGITREAYSICVPRHANVLLKNQWIEFYGRRTHKETISELSRADFMINYRDKNVMTEAGISTKMVESVSVGTPVIMNNIGEAFDYLIKNETGIELLGDMEYDIKTLIKLCKKTAEERVKMKIKCKSSNIFFAEKYINSVKFFLEKLI